MSDNLIPLQAAYITKGCIIGEPWRVCESGTNRELATLSGTLDEKAGMSYLHFARKFELEALNKGIEFGKSQEHDRAEIVFQQMRNQIAELEKQNIGLSTHLEKLIIGEGE